MGKIIDFFKGVFGIFSGTTKVSKDLVYEAKKGQRPYRVKTIFINQDDVIEIKECLMKSNGLTCHIPPDSDRVYAVEKNYKILDGKSLKRVVIIQEGYPKTVNLSNLVSDLGRMCSVLMATVTQTNIVSQALGEPSDREKKYILAIGFVLGMITGIAIMFLFVKSITG